MESVKHHKTFACKDCSKVVRRDKLASHLFTNHRDKLQAHILKVGKIILPVEYQYQFLCMCCHKAFTTKAKALKHLELNPDTCSLDNQTTEIVSLIGINASDKLTVTYNTMGVSQKTLKLAQNAAQKYSDKWVNDSIQYKEQNALLTAEVNSLRQKIISLENRSSKTKQRLAEAQLALLQKKYIYDKEIFETRIELLSTFIDTQVYFKKLLPEDSEYIKRQSDSVAYDENQINTLQGLQDEIDYHKHNLKSNGEVIETEPVEPKPEPKPARKPEPEPEPVEEKKCSYCPGEYEDDLYKCFTCKKWKHHTNEMMDCYSYECTNCSKSFCLQCNRKNKYSTKLNPYCSKECYEAIN
jgi:hypothetical protein